MNKIVLLSHILDSSTPSYGNRDKLIVEHISRISDGKSANSSSWFFSSNHLGTHVDMPHHFFNDGKTITDYGADSWVFNNIQLIDVPCEAARIIAEKDISNKIDNDSELLLIRTGYEKYRDRDKYWNDNPGLAPSLGFYIRENYKNIRAVGFDFISLSSWKYRALGKEAHKEFLNPGGINSPIWIIEDMKLNDIEDGLYKILICPLFINNSNGSPVSVFGFINDKDI